MPDIIPPAPAEFTPDNQWAWMDFYKRIRDAINTASIVTWANLDFSGSNLTDLVTRNHNDLQNVQGGGAGERYHLTATQHTNLVAGAASSTDNAITRFDGTSGKTIQNSGATIDDSGNLTANSITTASTTLHTTSVALTNGAGAGAGTITNAPAAGNPTKWIPINDNGTTRYIPAW